MATIPTSDDENNSHHTKFLDFLKLLDEIPIFTNDLSYDESRKRIAGRETKEGSLRSTFCEKMKTAFHNFVMSSKNKLTATPQNLLKICQYALFFRSGRQAMQRCVEEEKRDQRRILWGSFSKIRLMKKPLQSIWKGFAGTLGDEKERICCDAVVYFFDLMTFVFKGSDAQVMIMEVVKPMLVTIAKAAFVIALAQRNSVRLTRDQYKDFVEWVRPRKVPLDDANYLDALAVKYQITIVSSADSSQPVYLRPSSNGSTEFYFNQNFYVFSPLQSLLTVTLSVDLPVQLPVFSSSSSSSANSRPSPRVDSSSSFELSSSSSSSSDVNVDVQDEPLGNGNGLLANADEAPCFQQSDDNDDYYVDDHDITEDDNDNKVCAHANGGKKRNAAEAELDHAIDSAPKRTRQNEETIAQKIQNYRTSDRGLQLFLEALKGLL